MLLRPSVMKQPVTAESNKSAGDDSAKRGVPPSFQPDTAASGAGIIKLLSGANAGRELELTKTLTTLGKPGVQVAVIAKRPQGFFITHVQGTQFPTVKGGTIAAQAHQLKGREVIEIEGVKMEFSSGRNRCLYWRLVVD